jgi:hypothetical protein
MNKKRKGNNKTAERREKALKSGQAKMARFERAMAGDEDALMECSYEAGICTKEQLDDYFKLKEEIDD